MAGVTSAERIARVVRAELDLRQVQHFVAVFEEQSIAGAARRLGVVPAAVSMQLRRLETAFGVVLFEPVLDVQRGHTSRSSCGYRLAVAMVLTPLRCASA